MKTIKLRPVEREPIDEDITHYPDFLIGCLLHKGIGRIEADRAAAHDDKVDFIFTDHKTGRSELVGSVGKGVFRPILARFGPRCGADEMLYSGHTLFACEWENEGKKRMHRFSLFICNTPAMGIWMKLYLYCIDGVWPTREKENQ